MTRLNQLFPAHLIEALGWTILHSLWQGAVLAILLTLTWIVLRKNSSQVRYFVATTALFTLFFVAVITFLSLYLSTSPVNTTVPATLQPPSAPNPPEVVLLLRPETPQTAALAESPSFWAGFGQYFEQHLPLIVSVWFLGVVVLMLRFLGGIAYLQRLKYYQNRTVSAQWQGTLRYLSAQLGVKQKVQLLESALVQVPMVIGYIKPVILMPLGTLSGLPVAQIESILAHELAHIRRHDYLVNILQSLVDIALFFNPFAWWISECVREERENCCDDLALQATGDVLTFAKTLANLEALRLDSPQLATSFVGSKGSLKQRIQRIIYGKSQRPTFSEGFFSALVLLVCMLAVSYQAKAKFFDLKDTLVNQVNEFINDKVEDKEKIVKADFSVEELEKADLLESVTLADTIRFGEDFMLITSPNGKDFQIFKAGKLLTEEEYAQFSNLFTVEDATIKITNEALGNKGVEIKMEDKLEVQGLRTWTSFDFDNDVKFEWVEPPFPPTVPDKGLMTSPSSPNGVTILRGYGYFNDPMLWQGKDFSFGIEGNRFFYFDDKKIEELQQELEILQEELELHKKNLNKQGKKSEEDAQNQLRQKRIEELSRKIEQKAKRLEQQTEYEAKALQRKAEWEKRQAEWAKRQSEWAEKYTGLTEKLHENVFIYENESKENLQKLKKELVKDGLAKSEKDPLKISYDKDELSINGKKLDDNIKAKYEELLRKAFNIRLKMNKNWNINISED